MAGAEFLYLTTTGRRTGRAREIEIWFTAADGAFYVIAEQGEQAQWVRNIVADPRVIVRVTGERLAATARVVDATAEPARARAAQQRSQQKYGWGDGLVVELRPVGRPERAPGPAGEDPATS